MINRLALPLLLLGIWILGCSPCHGMDMGDAFSLIGYRPRPMVRRVTRSAAWNENRREILDWGCGGGCLARALAKEGATRVVAVDVNANATNVATMLLEPYPNAQVMKKPRFAFWGRPGHIGYREQFDFVLSYCGPLTHGVPDGNTTNTMKAMDEAVRACRVGGKVISIEILNSPHYKYLIGIVLAGVIGYFGKGPGWSKLWHAPGWTQYAFWLLVTWPLGGLTLTLDLAFFMKNIARSFMLRKWRLSSIICATLPLLFSWHVFRKQWRTAKFRKLQMRFFGLDDVRCYPRLTFCPFTAVQPKDRARMWMRNLCTLPMSTMLILEGVKKKNGAVAPKKI